MHNDPRAFQARHGRKDTVTCPDGTIMMVHYQCSPGVPEREREPAAGGGCTLIHTCVIYSWNLQRQRRLPHHLLYILLCIGSNGYQGKISLIGPKGLL